MVSQAETKDGHRRLEVQSDLFVPSYLRNAFQWFGDIFRICNNTIALTEGKKLEEVLAAGIKFYEADMRVKGIPSN